MSAKPLEIQESLVQKNLLMRRNEALDFYQYKIGSILLNSSGVHPYKIHFTGYHKTPKWFVIMPCIRLGEFFTPQQAISLQVELRKNDHHENQNAYYIANYCDEQGEDRTKCYLLIHLWELKNLSDKVLSSSKDTIEKKCDAEASNLHYAKPILSQGSTDLNKQKELKQSLESIVSNPNKNVIVQCNDKEHSNGMLFLYSKDFNPNNTFKIINNDIAVVFHGQEKEKEGLIF